MIDNAQHLNAPGQVAPKARILQSVLYITYDGILEPLGYSQVYQYLRKLSQQRQIFLISFEKAADWNNSARRRRVQDEVAKAKIAWIPLRYHKTPTPAATAYDLTHGMLVASYLVACHRIAIVHARSYVPSVLALALKAIFGVRFIFDMRGFWPEERVDAGLWSSNSRLFKVAKWFERRFLLAADAVVSLTVKGVSEMQRFDYLTNRQVDFHVISTCVDLERFRPRSARVRCAFTLGYVGTTVNWYMMDPAAECFRLLLEMRPDARILILNRAEHDFIRKCLRSHGVQEDRVELIAVDPGEMPRVITRVDASVFFIKPVYSKKASAPTKLGELLAAGIPCLTNAGVGDMDQILTRERVGIAVERFDIDSLREGLARLIDMAEAPGIQLRCRAAAMRNFSLDSAVQAYSQIYKSVSTPHSAQ
jgi:glycosyltransferase involved in cell wall biosynthesis